MRLGCIEEGVESLKIRCSPGYAGDFRITSEKGFSAADARSLFSLFGDQSAVDVPLLVSEMVNAARNFVSTIIRDEEPEDKKKNIGRGSLTYFNRFKEMGVIGSGSFAHVALCWHKKEEKFYAVKKIRLGVKELNSQAVQEVRVLKKMNHPHVVTCYDTWCERGFINSLTHENSSATASSNKSSSANIPDEEAFCQYIQMEFCPLTLREFLDRYDFSQGNFVWQAFEQIVVALDHIHKGGVVHLDINPRNIFLDFEDKVKIADFGLAKSTEKSTVGPISEDTSYSCSGQPGTGVYRAPEVLAVAVDETKKKKISEKADMFSLGIILFEMWYKFGESGHERIRVCTDIGTDRVLPAEWSKAHPRQASLILELTATEPSDRPSAKQVLEQLRNHS
ncbi:PREDICTED: eIF-2-alpha kinase GCN2-like [Camelina sativa]|uniref:EIF-2-alpha kinase GCN2-like n=1 Tax=Camelina sativa TaxID=90675 RepID=A0ABM1RMN3_CAMSA|nr:PREDICTED: eIF-2-alpha kinase GCN2-like [Camelina sativa]